jgi:branched-subunit amino acid ABC-type transport system permease component
MVMVDPTAELFTPRDAQNYRTYNAWMFGSLLAFMAATLLIDGKFIPAAAGWALAAATAALMLMAVRSYVLFLRYADELLRKVHLESLAFAFGAGIVVMMVYRLCERLGAPKLDVNDAALVMMVTWIAGQWIGARRYAAAEER